MSRRGEETYTVLWAAEINAPTPEVAAQIAWLQQHDPESRATKFVVKAADGTKTIIDIATLREEN